MVIHSALFRIKYFRIPRLRFVSVPIMPQPKNKEEWIALLNSMGEAVDKTWTILEMKSRYAEIKPAAKDPDSLETKLTALRQAARKKPDLKEHLEVLGVEVTRNDTIATMFSRAERYLHSIHEPVGTEKVKFGQHAHMTYQEVVENKAQYVDWCRKTAAEGDSGWQLQRLVRYADQVHHAEKYKKSQGYGKTGESATSSSVSFSVVSHVPEDAAQTTMLAQLQEQAKEMKKLKAQLKEIQDEKIELELKDARSKTRKEM